MEAPIASGVPVEQVIATQTKRIISGTVGSAASNALMDRYDLNPYMAMGIGMGISNITYEGINSIEVDTTLGITASSDKGLKSITLNKKDIQSYTYNIVENLGPLAEIDGQPAKNFFGGKYNFEVLDDDRIYYRAGEKGSPLGQWFTSEPAESIAKVRIETVVKPQWIDPATGKLTGTSTIDTNYAIKIPAGTTVYTGLLGIKGEYT